MSSGPNRKPVSEKSLAANRANAKRSTGPRTPEGKAKASKNACKHHLYARLHLAPDAVLQRAAEQCQTAIAGIADPRERALASELVFSLALFQHQTALEAAAFDWAAQVNQGDMAKAAHWLFSEQSQFFAALLRRTALMRNKATRAERALQAYRRHQTGEPGAQDNAAATPRSE